MDAFGAGLRGPVGLPVTYRPSPNRGYPSGHRRVRAIIWHITDGGLQSSLDWLTSSASQASANYVIGRDGSVWCLVPPDESAWCNGRIDHPNLDNPIVAQAVAAGVNPNLWTVSIELEGRPFVRDGIPPTPAQEAALVTLSAWLARRYWLSVDSVHLFGHRDWDSVNRRNCPGLTDQQWEALTARVKEKTIEARGW